MVFGRNGKQWRKSSTRLKQLISRGVHPRVARGFAMSGKGPRRLDEWESFVVKLATRTRDLSSTQLLVTFAPPTKTKDSLTIKFLAIDLGKFNSVCCFYNTKTRRTKFLTTPTTREHFKTIFEDCGAERVVNRTRVSSETPRQLTKRPTKEKTYPSVRAPRKVDAEPSL